MSCPGRVAGLSCKFASRLVPFNPSLHIHYRKKLRILNILNFFSVVYLARPSLTGVEWHYYDRLKRTMLLCVYKR